MRLDSKSYEVDGAECECVAGKDPTASCKHIAALCYALEDFSRKRQLPSYLTCTDRLQTWNQPRPRKLQPIPVEGLRTRKRKYEIMPPKIRSSQQTRIDSQFDPRPEAFRKHDPKASEKLRCSLSLMNKPCAFLHILVHTYCLKFSDTADIPSVSALVNPSSNHDIYTAHALSPEDITARKELFHVSTALQHQIEERTRKQSNTDEWYDVRAQRITSSMCGQILNQNSKTVALLHRCLYPKPLLDPLPRPIVWGRKNEEIACKNIESIWSNVVTLVLIHTPVVLSSTTKRAGLASS